MALGVEQTSHKILSDLPIACHEIDASGRVVYINAAECQLLGFTEAEILGQPVWNFVAPEEQEMSRAAVQDKLAGYQQLACFERDYMRPDGVRVNLEIHEKYIFDQEERIAGIRSFLIDVTQRKRTEQALQESEKNIRHLIEHASDIIYRTDINGRFVFFNPVATTILRYPSEALLGRSYLDLVRPDYRHQVRHFYRSQLAKNIAQTYLEFPAMSLDGAEVWFGQNVQLIKEGERTVGFQAVTRDITKQRRAGEEERHAREDLERRVQERTAELQTANDLLRREMEERRQAEAQRRRLELQIQHSQRLESLGVLAGGIAHDFNNLLTAIMGHASLAQLSLPEGSSARTSIDAVLTASHSAAELTRQMLAYSGRGKFVIQVINISRLIEETSRFVATLLSKKAVLRLNLDPALPAIRGDASQIRQVLINLLTNASESLGDKAGEIRVSTGVLRAMKGEIHGLDPNGTLSPGEYVFLEVADTGCGMDQATLARVFEPFFTTKFTGRGLGLAAVIGIVRGHGGTMQVQSEPGRGSNFRVLFPAAAHSKADASPAVDAADVEYHIDGVVLVVDDEPMVRDLTAKILEGTGLTVMTAVDGHDAIRVFTQHSDEIRVVLLDLTMPGMDGIEVLQQITKINARVKVFLSSGYNLQDLDLRLGPKAVAGFLRKPYLAGDLIRCMRLAFAKGQ